MHQLCSLAQQATIADGPTLKEAYDKWVLSGRAAEVDKYKDAYLGWIQANL